MNAPPSTPSVVIPRVTLVVEIEADPRLIVEGTKADRQALGAWIRECRPDLDRLLSDIARELQEKRAA